MSAASICRLARFLLAGGFTLIASSMAIAADTDGDGIPDDVEVTEARNPNVKDNDVFTSNRLFAMQQYRDFLGREGDAGGIQFYVDALNTGPLVRANVIENFFNSPEFQGVGSPIARLYFATFLRIPDYGGLLFQIDAFRSGTPLTVIANNFTLSPEFISRYGAISNSQYVVLLYQNILSRTPVQAEIDFHVNRLVTGATRGEVLVGFSESPEYRNNTAHDVFVTMMYVGMLRRAPEQAGFDYWVAYMDAGNAGLALILGFLNAPEFHDRFLSSTTRMETCNGRDDNGDGQIDEGLGTVSSGLGACRRTVPACTAGVLGVAVAGTPAANDATADGIDDNCNGAVDEDSGFCVRVGLIGNDATADGTALLPFRTIQAAINYSAANPLAPKQVCVAAGPACVSVTATYPEDVVMANGVSVYGSYESTGWTRCTNGAAVTAIQPAVAEGVRFPASVVTPTTLYYFRIDRASMPTTSGITVDGAQNVLLASVLMTNKPAAQRSYGVNVINGGQATVAESRIVGGAGSIETIGVRAVNSQVAVMRNCRTFDLAGRCIAFAGSNNRAILGRELPGTGESYAVLLDNSPLSTVEESSLSANYSDVGAMIRIRGNGAGIRIRANTITAVGGALDSHGIWAEDCADASPWIVNNFSITAEGTSSTSRSSGIRAIGSCHPVVEGNSQISGGTESGSGAGIGIHCGRNASEAASQCVVVNNAQIAGGGGDVSSTGILCEDASCVRIEGNGISNSLPAPDTYGVRLGRTGVRVEANTISAGCGVDSSTGVLSIGSTVRLVNNFISGAFGCAVPSALSRGLHVVNTGEAGEVDVHSNTIVARGAPVACTSVALEMDASIVTPPNAAKGIFRNNILHGGDCFTRYGVRELVASADPRVFENNDIVPAGAASALYLDEGTAALSIAAQVNALADMTVANILALDPLFASYPANLQLQITSPLRRAGTVAGAPATDFFGTVRNPAMPSIGAHESP